MLIRLHKGRDKPNMLVCERDDGSTTIARLNIPVEHDLVHYAVETTLGYTHGFYGLVAGGMSIEDFSRPHASRDLPAQALRTEFIVGLLQIEMRNGVPYADFNAELARAAAAASADGRGVAGELRAPISDDQLQRIREEVAGLLGRWAKVSPGESLELVFDP